MRETLQAILLDSEETSPPTGVPRRLSLRAVRGKAAVCIGVRRCGKSTYLFQLIERLVRSGVPRQNVLYLNFFDDRLHALRQDGLGQILDAYHSLHPEKKGTERVHCFFDEIQAVAGWEPFIDRLLRTEECEVYLTGSSARMLSKEIATQMRGRALSWELFPFSFREYLDARGLDGGGPYSTRAGLLIRKAFDEYWECGGFPETLDLDRQLRVKTHQEYLQAILFRDLVERHDVAHPRAVSDLAHRLLENTASLYTVNKLTHWLQSLGHKVPKASVSDYLAWFEDAYFLFSVEVFDASLARRRTNPKRVYCIDHSLVTSVSSGLLVNSGHLLENLVFVALRRAHPQVWYHKTRNGREVDFVVPGSGRKQALVQVCESLIDPRTREREIKALAEAMEELDLEDATLVTRDEAEEVEVGRRRVRVVPAWRFLLEVDPAQVPA